MQTNEQLQNLYTTYIAQGGDPADVEVLLGWLRTQSCSVVESIRVLMLCQGLSLAEAKRRVHTSAAWSDRRAEHDKFHEELEQMARAFVNEVNKRGSGTL
jgi:hypothetical protein